MQTSLEGGRSSRSYSGHAYLACGAGDWKLIFDHGRAMLFNLRDDISERQDLIGRQSDVARRLRPLLEAWEKDVNTEAKQTVPPR